MNSHNRTIYDAHLHVSTSRPWQSGKLKDLFSDFDEVQKKLKAAGVAGAVAITDDNRENQELLASASHYQGPLKFWFFWWVNADSSIDLPSLEKNIDDVSGIKFHPSVDKRKITDERYAPYFQLARRHGKPVMVHCGQWQEIAGYKWALEAAKQNPDLEFILGHMGGWRPDLARAAATTLKSQALENVVFDVGGTVDFEALKECATKILSPRHYLYASDYPSSYPAINRNISLVDNLPISHDDKEYIFHKNLTRILKL